MGGQAAPGRRAGEAWPFSICLINARLPSNTRKEAGLQGAAHVGQGQGDSAPCELLAHVPAVWVTRSLLCRDVCARVSLFPPQWLCVPGVSWALPNTYKSLRPGVPRPEELPAWALHLGDAGLGTGEGRPCGGPQVRSPQSPVGRSPLQPAFCRPWAPSLGTACRLWGAGQAAPGCVPMEGVSSPPGSLIQAAGSCAVARRRLFLAWRIPARSGPHAGLSSSRGAPLGPVPPHPPRSRAVRSPPGRTKMGRSVAGKRPHLGRLGPPGPRTEPAGVDCSKPSAAPCGSQDRAVTESSVRKAGNKGGK